MKFLMRISAVFILFFIAHNNCFTSLRTAIRYAQELPEYPDTDAPQDWNKPSYAELYKTIKPRWFRSLLQELHVLKQPLWSPKQFAKQLQAYAATVNKENFREYIIGTAVTAEEPLELYCFGSIHGSFHSLMRCLQDLQSKGIIDDSFVIQKPKTSLVFLGSAIDNGPYSLEVLSLIFMLQQKNPLRVVYLRGEHEEKLVWYNYTLYQEIQMRGGSLKKSLMDDIQTYFESQPQAVYITDSETPRTIVCLKADAMTQGDELWEDFLQVFFTELRPQKVDRVFVYDRPRAERLLFPRVILEARNDWSTVAPTQAVDIRFVEHPLVTIFSLASCPSRPYRYLYRLFSDAYVHIGLRAKFSESILHAWTRDVRTDDAFSVRDYDLVSGKEI